MSLDEKIKAMNAAHDARKAAEADATEKERIASIKLEKLKYDLRNLAPTFLNDLLKELRKQTIQASQQIKEHRFKVFAGNGPYGSAQTMLAFGEQGGPYYPVPAIIIQVADKGDELVKTTFTAPKECEHVPVSWQVTDDKQLQLLKNGEPQTIESFSEELIEQFLKRFAR